MKSAHDHCERLIASVTVSAIETNPTEDDLPTSILSDLQSLRSQIRPPTHEPQTQLSPAFGGDGNQPLSMLPPMGDNFTPAAAGDGVFPEHFVGG
jgi:hypothetical protein